MNLTKLKKNASLAVCVCMFFFCIKIVHDNEIQNAVNDINIFIGDFEKKN